MGISITLRIVRWGDYPGWSGWAQSKHKSPYKRGAGTSLVAQGIRICLPRQGTWVQSLVWEDSTARGATKAVHHNCWAHTLESRVLAWRAATTKAHMSRSRPPKQEKPPQGEAGVLQLESSPCSLQVEKALIEQWRPSAAKHKDVFCKGGRRGRKSDGTMEAEVWVTSGRGREPRNADHLYGVCYNIASVLYFGFLAPRHVQSCFPSQR